MRSAFFDIGNADKEVFNGVAVKDSVISYQTSVISFLPA